MKIIVLLISIFCTITCSISDDFDKSFYLVESIGNKFRYIELYILSNGDILFFTEPTGLIGIRSNIQFSDDGDSAIVKSYYDNKVDTLIRIKNTENYLNVNTQDTLTNINSRISNKMSIENPSEFENQAFERMKKNCRKCK